MKTKRFDFNFKPLQINISMFVDGSVPGRQNYDADTDEYTPDYTITPLILQPVVSVLDKDEVLQAGRVNAKLTNIQWRYIVNGVSTLVSTTDSNFEMTTAGTNAGRISVKMNAAEKAPITMLFSAEYLDSRTNQIYNVQSSYMIKCDNSTAEYPVVQVDAADQTIYNPLKDVAAQIVNAVLRLGTVECVNTYSFVWEKWREDTKTWTAVGSDDTADYALKVSDDTKSIAVDRSLMGTELYLRCRAVYTDANNTAAATLSDASPYKVIAFIRRIPKYEFDYNIPTNIPSGTLYIYPEAMAWDTNGAIANPDSVLLPIWYMATDKTSGTLSYTQIAHGMTPAISTALINTTLGGVLGLDMVDVGPACAWADSDGALFVDGDGNIILIN